jgi:arabinan endo-1,5-alpha-L-arabinosidase
LTPLPTWISTWNSGSDTWAPDVVSHNSKYWQYYAVPGPQGTSHTAAIGLATATTANSTSWSDQGIVIQSSDSSPYNAIDPNPVQDTSGNWWMAFGSWTDGLYMVPLSTTTGKLANSNQYHLAERAAGIEGSFVYYNSPYYYLFASINLCCESNSPYRIVVGRSSTVTGPYLDRGGINMLSGGGTIVLSTHSNIVGPGGQSVLADSSGPVLVYHYYDGNNGGTPTLGINNLGFDSGGWPYVH